MKHYTDPPSCGTRRCLEGHEGEMVDITGRYIYPKEPAFAVNKLELKDGTTIVVSVPQNELADMFIEENDGAELTIRGRIFTGMIPDKYRIKGRTAEPHLLDVERVERADQ